MERKKLLEIFGGVLWVTNYDIESVPFYQKEDPDLKGTALNADLLFGIGEVVGAGERCSSQQELLDSLVLHENSIADYEWYIQMKEKYPLKTAGFGMGIERYFLWLLKGNDIRDIQLLPRENGVNILP